MRRGQPNSLLSTLRSYQRPLSRATVMARLFGVSRRPTLHTFITIIDRVLARLRQQTDTTLPSKD
jgi:hypothetical protein